MLNLPWTTVRGLHVLKCLERHGKAVSTSRIAAEVHLSAANAARLISRLRELGFVESRPGKGFVLARPAAEIVVADVVRGLGAAGPRPARCRADYATCTDRSVCALGPWCREANEALEETFRRHTIAGLESELPALF
jgi:Rrf2 family protein